MSIDSFDLIIGMDTVRTPSCRRPMFREDSTTQNPPNGDPIIVYGDKPGDDLRIVSYVKAQKDLQKKCPAFLAHIVDRGKEVEKIQDVQEVRDFPDVFPEDLPGLPRSDKSNLESTDPRRCTNRKSTVRTSPFPTCRHSLANSRSC
jgi:hypothetical protein